MAKGVRAFGAAAEDRKGGCAGGQTTAVTAGDCQRAFALYLGGDYMNSPSRRASPLTFEPIFMERIWGGRKFADLLGKNLPSNKPIGESWEIVDRPEAQSVVSNGPLKAKRCTNFGRNIDKKSSGHCQKRLASPSNQTTRRPGETFAASPPTGKNRRETWRRVEDRMLVRGSCRRRR